MKKNIAIVYGGDSGEYDVSIRSGEVVNAHLDTELFSGYLVLIRGNRWVYTDNTGVEHEVDRNDFSLKIGDKPICFDAVFNAIHGTPGEDGKMQGYLEMLSIPVTSCDQATSALTFNKYFCNQFVRSLGLHVSTSVIVHKGENWRNNALLSSLELPVFVKPNRGGSSVGTTKVKDHTDMEAALERAFKEDDQVMVEEFIPGREITCGVVTWKGEALALPLTEIVSKTEFFDYEAKYLGKSDEITPAPVPAEMARLCQETSLMLYSQLNCRGMIRCDYIFNDHGLFFLEVNTVPGLSEASIVPQQAREIGISLRELFTEVILDAIARP